jgi:hypothetical protein
MKYRKIVNSSGTIVPGKMLKSIKHKVRHRTLKAGKFTCLCHNGNTHIWDIQDKDFKAKGYGKKPNKKKGGQRKASKTVFNVVMKLVDKIR